MQSVADTKARRKRPALSPAEREVIITAADDEDHWTVSTYSTRPITKQILKIAQQYGVVPECQTYGYLVRLPRESIRLRGPRRKSEKQQRHLARLRETKAHRQKDHSSAQEPLEISPPQDLMPEADADLGTGDSE